MVLQEELKCGTELLLSQQGLLATYLILGCVGREVRLLGWFGADFYIVFVILLVFYSPFWGQEGSENDPEP